MGGNRNSALVLLLIIGLLLWAAYLIPRLSDREQTERLNYTELLTAVRERRVATMEIVRGTEVNGEYRGEDLSDKDPTRFRATVAKGIEHPADTFLRLDPSLEIAVKESSLGDKVLQAVGTFLVPLAVLLFFYFLVIRQMQSTGSQAMSFGRSRHKMVSDAWEKVTFDDVAGMEESKEELQEIVEFLKDPEKFRALGAKIPRGVLLLGPPGCGKTLLARAVAGEAEVSFFYISGSDFVEMFVGVGASRVRDLFEQAKHNLPAIVFIDEIDAVGRQRGYGIGGGHDEREQTLNALLVEMDGFDPNSDVIILAATNRPDILDPALLRPGRFDRRVVVTNPDVKERRAILGLYVKDKPVSDEVDAEVIARRTPGFSGADLENLVNEAALLAARRDKTVLEMEDFDESIDRVIAGPERKSRVIGERERKILAYHEAGHALVSNMLPDFDPTYKVTILPRGMALGYTIRLPQEDRHLVTKQELLNTICMTLAGRAAEEAEFSEVTTGAQDDLEKATELARQMVCEFGMSEELGPVTFGKKHGPVFLARDMVEERNYSEDMARRIDGQIHDLIEGSHSRARTVVGQNREALANLADILLEEETLEQEQVAAIIATGRLPEAVDERPADADSLEEADDEASLDATAEEATPGLVPDPQTS